MTKCETDKSGEEDPDRTDEKENFEGTDDTLETKSISAPSDTAEPKKEKQRALSNHPDTYNAMGVHGELMEHPVIFFYEDGSRGRDVLMNFLGDAELKSIMSDDYNAYVFIGDELKTTTSKNLKPGLYGTYQSQIC